MMSNLKLIYVILFVCVPYIFANSLVLGTWNVRYANTQDSIDGNGWGKRLNKIVDMVRFYDFDILLLQEPDSNQVRDVASRLIGYDLIKTDSSSYHPIFYKKEKINLSEMGQFWFSEDGTSHAKGWDARYPRFCSWARMEYDNRSFYVFNAHWDHKGREARKASAKLALTEIEKIAGQNMAIFAGDLNTDTDSSPYNTLKESPLLEDSKDLAKISYMPNRTFTLFNVNDYAGWQLDHIFVTPIMSILKYGILDDRYYDGRRWRYPSDHLPVMIRFEVK